MSVENRYYVYIHRKEDTNDVFYVGKGSGERAKQTTSRSRWWTAVKDKHGFTVEIIEKGLSEFDAFNLEIETIKFYRECGYNLVNLTNGGEGSSGYSPSAETRAKLSAAHKGRVFSDDWRGKLSVARKGWVPSEDTREKLRLGSTGKKHSKETIEKRAIKLRKPVRCSNGMIFDSLSDVLTWLKCTGRVSETRKCATGVSMCCSGHRHFSYGFSWSYIELDEVIKEEEDV